MRLRLIYFVPALLLVRQTLLANDPSSARVVSHIPRHHIASTALRSIGYSKRRHILEVEFVNGAIYRYYEVAPSVYQALLTADSKARYYDFNIKHKYLSARVKRPALARH